MAGAKYNLIHPAYFCLWALCALVELVSAYSHWNRGLRLMPQLLLGPYGGLGPACRRCVISVSSSPSLRTRRSFAPLEMD